MSNKLLLFSVVRTCNPVARITYNRKKTYSIIKKTSVYHTAICIVSHIENSKNDKGYITYYITLLPAPEPLNRFSKNFAQLITSVTPPHTQKFGSVAQRGRICACVKLSSSGVYFLGFLVSCSSLQVHPLDR